MKDIYRKNPDLLQINWHQLYETNQKNEETVQNVNGISGHNITGKRAHYIIQKCVLQNKKFIVSSVINTQLTNRIQFTGSTSVNPQKNHYFLRVKDLLGADFWVNINSFYLRTDNANDTKTYQYNIDKPNEIIRQGSKYGHDYHIIFSNLTLWGQTVFKLRKFDFFTSIKFTNDNFFRIGNVRNGLFPNHSFGKSKLYNFMNYNIKTGITFKIDGRNYL